MYFQLGLKRDHLLPGFGLGFFVTFRTWEA